MMVPPSDGRIVSHIERRFVAVAASEDGSMQRSEHGSRLEAHLAAERMRAEIQQWIDTEGLGAAQQAGHDAIRWLASAEVRCELYKVGDDDITDDPVAQDIVEAVLQSPHVRWPVSREGSRAGRQTRLLFADTPTPGHWGPIPLADSEAMLEWCSAHGVSYPDSARRARRKAREDLARDRRSEEGAKLRRVQVVLQSALAEVARLEAELARARSVAAAAQLDVDAAAKRHDDRLRWHAEEAACLPALSPPAQ